MNRNTQGVEFVPIDGPTEVVEEAVSLIWLRLHCPGQKVAFFLFNRYRHHHGAKVKVRAAPSIKSKDIGKSAMNIASISE